MEKGSIWEWFWFTRWRTLPYFLWNYANYATYLTLCMDRILNKQKRPFAITVICILGFLGVIFLVGVLLIDFNVLFRAFQKLGSWYFPYLISSAIIGSICFIGIWYMRKWALYIYTTISIINLIVLIMIHASTITIIISIIYVLFIWFYSNKMRWKTITKLNLAHPVRSLRLRIWLFLYFATIYLIHNTEQPMLIMHGFNNWKINL